MSLGIIGRKCGMTEIFTDTGESHAVTVVELLSNRVSQLKTADTDGYTAIQVAYGKKRTSLINKPALGHLAKAKIDSALGLHEFRVSANALTDLNLGDELSLGHFEEGQALKIRGVSKGKGFQGGVKRHNFHMQDATHGNSVSHRALGSTGQCQTPGRVFKGKKMAGQMGNVTVTVRNRRLIKLDADQRIMFIAGGLPGANGCLLEVYPNRDTEK